MMTLSLECRLCRGRLYNEICNNAKLKITSFEFLISKIPVFLKILLAQPSNKVVVTQAVIVIAVITLLLTEHGIDGADLGRCDRECDISDEKKYTLRSDHIKMLRPEQQRPEAFEAMYCI